MKRPLVSIGMPTYNRAHTLERSIQALLHLKYKNIELIISDNASTDSTASILSTYARKDPRVRIYRQKKNIPGRDNFEFVLQKAKGEYFFWASDDDKTHEDFINVLLPFFERDTEKKLLLASPWWNTIDQLGRVRNTKKSAAAYLLRRSITFAQFLAEGYQGYKWVLFFGLYRRKHLQELYTNMRMPYTPDIDQYTLHTILSKSDIRLVHKRLFTKSEFYSDARHTDHKILRGVAAWVTHPIVYLRMLANVCIPSRAQYFVSKTLLYYKFNDTLISTLSNPVLKLRLLNIYSSVLYFFNIIPIQIALLKRRTKSFTGRE